MYDRATCLMQAHARLTSMNSLPLLRRVAAAHSATSSCAPRWPLEMRLCPGASLVGFATCCRRMEECGSTAAEYDYIEGAEDLFAYKPGGYHPILIGDQIHCERYRMVHKLGHGAYSTVWLGRDRDSDQLVAIKIGLAGSASNEVATLLAVKHKAKERVKDVPTVLNHFEINGPNGTHPCYVMSPAMGSLNDAKDAGTGRLFPVDVARALTAQLLQAVARVHRHGFVHGDIHPGNVLLQLPPSFSRLSDQELYKQYGEPVLETVTRSDGDISPLPRNVPPQVVMPVWLAKRSDKLSINDANLVLSDFGEAFAPSRERRAHCNTPLGSRPPECRFEVTQPVSFPADIWMLACTVWQICGARPLFDSSFATEDSITRQQVEALGKLPPPWWARWETRAQFYVEDGTLLASYPRRTLSIRMQQHMVKPRVESGAECFADEELVALEDMLRGMLSFLPQDRPTIDQVLNSEWVKSWASGHSNLGNG